MMIIEYDGQGFYGWQIQPKMRTVQGALSKSLSTILREKIKLIGAGRTDAGVHAYGQVANFNTKNRMNPESIRKSVNSILPYDIYVNEASYVPDEFNSRYDAKSKVYIYRVLQKRAPLRRYYAWQVKYKLNIESMNQAARYLIGQQDLSSFTVELKNNNLVRVLKAGWRQEKNELVFKVEADRFLNKLVRMMVGRMVEIGRGRFSPEVVVELLQERKKGLATPTAPAHGLFLLEVKY